MTLPRQVLAGENYMVTRRCAHRQLLMRPDEETTQAYEYCLAVAAERFGVELLFTIAMSNHHHTGIRDVEGRYPEFLEYFHKLFAKCQNVLRGRWENFWSSEQTSMVRLTGAEDIFEKLIYAVTNPVKEGLVDSAMEWPGASSWGAHQNGGVRVIRRPRHFFREEGLMPEKVTLEFRRPRGFEMLTQSEWASRIAKRIRRVEMDAAAARLREGRRTLGVRGVLSQKWSSTPRTREPRRNMSPRVAAKNTWRRIEALRRNSVFLSAYRAAREALRDGYNYALFPEGTYWMARFLEVVCALAPPGECTTR